MATALLGRLNQLPFHIYCEDYVSFHTSIIINNKEKIIKLIESSIEGNIRIWNFHSTELLNKIKVSDKWLYTISLWKDKYLFVGSTDKLLILIDMDKKEIIKKYIGQNNRIICIKLFNHPKYGESVLSQGFKDDQINLWEIKY